MHSFDTYFLNAKLISMLAGSERFAVHCGGSYRVDGRNHTSSSFSASICIKTQKIYRTYENEAGPFLQLSAKTCSEFDPKLADPKPNDGFKFLL